MFGLRTINNIYVADGTGRDSSITLSREFKGGRSISPNGGISAFAGTPCYPKKRPHGPKPPSSLRIQTLYKGTPPPSSPPPSRAYSLPQLASSWAAAPGARPYVSPMAEVKQRRTDTLGSEF